MRDSKFVSDSKGTPFRPRIPDNLRDEMRELTGHKPRQMNDLAIRYIAEGIARDKEKSVMTISKYAAQIGEPVSRVQCAYVDSKNVPVTELTKEWMQIDHEIDDELLRKMNSYFGILNKAQPE